VLIERDNGAVWSSGLLQLVPLLQFAGNQRLARG
jgi:hypothetical protein